MAENQRLSEAALRAIEALAQKATPGPWRASIGVRSNVQTNDGDHPEIIGVCGSGDSHRHRKANQKANAEFIAALSPDVVLALVAAARERAQTWRECNCATPPAGEVFFWIVPKTADETYLDTSGRPIVSTHAPYLHRGQWGSWGALSKATHWMPLPEPPPAAGGERTR